MKATNKAKALLGILIFLIMGLNVTSIEGESEDSLQLLVVGLKDNEAVLSGIGIGGDATGEVSIELRDESDNIITTEPLGVTSNMSSNIWVSFADKKVRMYNSCGEIQSIDGVNWYWQTSAMPDGLDYDGSGLVYCSSSNNKLYRIEPTNGQDTEIGMVKRRLSLDGVATDNTSVQYTTQEYENYSPTGISGSYLVSGGLGKISKRDLDIGANFIQTLPSGTPIWTNEQDTPGSCLGITQIADTSVPEGHVVYISSTDGNIYKVRFGSKVANTLSPTFTNNILKLTYLEGPDSGKTYYQPNPTDVCGAHVGIYEGPGAYYGPKRRGRRRMYWRFFNLSTLLEAKIVYRSAFNEGSSYIWNGSTWAGVSYPDYDISTTILEKADYDSNKLPDESYDDWYRRNYNASSSGTIVSNSWDGVISGTEPIVHISDVTGILTGSFYFRRRYTNEEQSLSVGSYPPPSPIPVGYIGHTSVMNTLSFTFAGLTDEGFLTVLDQFTTSIPVPQGLAVGRLQIVDVDIDSDNNDGINPPNRTDT